MDNIEKFNLIVGEIFGLCYAKFPEPAQIRRSQIVHKIYDVAGIEYNSNNLDLREPDYEVVRCTITWLIQAGYIWDCGSDMSFYEVRLTPIGLSALNMVPDSLDKPESFGKKLAKGVSSIGKDTVTATVTTILNNAITNA